MLSGREEKVGDYYSQEGMWAGERGGIKSRRQEGGISVVLGIIMHSRAFGQGRLRGVAGRALRPAAPPVLPAAPRPQSLAAACR
jgi:hypothetical protein